MDEEWITIKGTHVLIDEQGNVKKGPESLKKVKKSEGLSEGLRPKREDYDYDPSNGFMDFVHKNVEKTRPIYDEEGMEGVEDEFFKVRLNDCTKDFKEISDEEIDRILDENVDDRIATLWLRNYEHEVKPKLVYELTQNSDVHNAALNIMFENYKTSKQGEEKPLSFQEFLTTPIKMYRGGSGKEYKKAGAFSSYTFDKDVAERFKNGPTGHEAPREGVIYEGLIRPIDTYGSLNTSGEAEIFVPRMIAPNGRKDEEEVRLDEQEVWERYNPVKWFFEDYIEKKSDFINSALESVINEAGLLKLFIGKDDECSKESLERCIDSVQKGIAQLTMASGESNFDSAFFSGELNDNIGERDILYPEVDAYRERRQKRLDAKKEPSAWITVNGNHIPVDEDGNPVGGQEKAIGKGEEPKTREELGKSKVERVRSKVKDGLDKYKKANDEVAEVAVEFKDVDTRYQRAKRMLDIDEKYRARLKEAGYAGMSNDKAGENPARRKPKVSWGR